MTNVIDFGAERDKRSSSPEPIYQFSADVYTDAEGTLSGRISGFNPGDGRSTGDRLRAFARLLEEMAANLRDDAQNMEPDEDGFVLGRFTIWENSRVRSWVSNRLATADQVAWMHDRLDEAKASIKPVGEP